ncbi:MAG: hypothetical protein IPI68_09300 [Chitinophagaceae bacterium]|nr:hypothetical protein [Chitinophagaceae bacterium]
MGWPVIIQKEKAPGTGDTDTTTSPTENNTPASNNAAPSAGSASVMYSVADTARNLAGSVLVQKDKDKLSPGNDYLAVVTTNGSDGESFVLNFLCA